jgi:hypothetical protein
MREQILHEAADVPLLLLLVGERQRHFCEIDRHPRRSGDALPGNALDGGAFGREERIEGQVELFRKAQGEDVRVLDARRAGLGIEAVRERLAQRVHPTTRPHPRFENRDVVAGPAELVRRRAAIAGSTAADCRKVRRFTGKLYQSTVDGRPSTVVVVCRSRSRLSQSKSSVDRRSRPSTVVGRRSVIDGVSSSCGPAS